METREGLKKSSSRFRISCMAAPYDAATTLTRGHLMRPLIGLVLLAGLAGCAGKSPPVPVQASAADIGRLAGRWEGEYNSDQTGRGGSIVFTLTAGSDTAQGDVLMIPAGSNQPIMREGMSQQPYTSSGPIPSVLSIRFVDYRDGQVSGALDPYRAPDCNCVVATTFIGTVTGDVIKGTFTIRGTPSPVPVTGEWEVHRHR
jgi:hypothetical protein